MNVRACKYCKRLFNYITGLSICPACKEALEEKFKVVKDYLWENKGASIQQTAQDCEVPEMQIRQWLKEGRIELGKDSAISLVCRQCGEQIYSGEICDRCKMLLAKGLSSAASSIRSSNTVPMGSNRQGMRYKS